MKLIENKILITHNKSEVVWPLDIVNKSNQILDLATNNDLHYFVMSLTKTRYKGRPETFSSFSYFRHQNLERTSNVFAAIRWGGVQE